MKPVVDRHVLFGSYTGALELQDTGTQIHSHRAAELTVQLARALRISSRDWVAIHRGALLHDIGKMNVPEAILFKPGPLTDEEWEIMRRHPEDARQMLASMQYQRQTIDIPYCHHEKWDGSGYPRGLKKEKIPLAARIFAVADVWDALTSDRPYRRAWSWEQALGYVREQAGRHFDPRVVEAFLKGDSANGKSAGKADAFVIHEISHTKPRR